jgi:hypothetical protein
VSTTVHLIVVSDYGERLRQLPTDEDAWVVDTPGNHAVIQRIWADSPHRGSVGITSFKVAPNASAEDWALDVLGTIDMHHGQDSEPPLYSALRVVGVRLSPGVQPEFESYGFIKFEETPDGFIAYKSSNAA